MPKECPKSAQKLADAWIYAKLFETNVELYQENVKLCETISNIKC